MPASKKWRLILDGAFAGAANMARDEAILLAVSKGESPPTLRFYSWDPPTVSVGYFQSLGKEVDVDRCRKAGFGIVRRPTGGRAVLHDDEVTYSVVIREADFPGTVVETYKRISLGLVSGLKRLLIEASLQAVAPQKQRASAACFDAPSWYEVIASGKKIIGSAQVRKLGTILQHGSVPLSFSPERIVDTLALPSDTARARLANHLAKKAGGLAEFMPCRPAPEDVARALFEGLSRELGISLDPSCLTRSELAETDRILEDKYSRDEWNLKR